MSFTRHDILSLSVFYGNLALPLHPLFYGIVHHFSPWDPIFPLFGCRYITCCVGYHCSSALFFTLVLGYCSYIPLRSNFQQLKSTNLVNFWYPCFMKKSFFFFVSFSFYIWISAFWCMDFELWNWLVDVLFAGLGLWILIWGFSFCVFRKYG